MSVLVGRAQPETEMCNLLNPNQRLRKQLHVLYLCVIELNFLGFSLESDS